MYDDLEKRYSESMECSTLDYDLSKIKYHKVALALLSMICHIVLLDFPSAIDDYNSILKSLNLKNIADLAFALAIKSMRNAIKELEPLLKEYELKKLSKNNKITLNKKIINEIAKKNILAYFTFNKDFLVNPVGSGFYLDVKQRIGKLFESINLDEGQQKIFFEELEKKFRNELGKEWRNNRGEYNKLKEFLEETPYSKDIEHIINWDKYKKHINELAEAEVFGEGYSLENIYIPLNAYYINENKNKVVVTLDKHLKDWLKNKDKKDHIRIISGGPGSGKSSFSKILASELIKTMRVLYIPLYQFDLDGKITESIENYFCTKVELFNKNPLNTDEKQILLILDGLDEFSEIVDRNNKKIGETTAYDFVNKIIKFLNDYNYGGRKVSAIITGRVASIQKIERLYKGKCTILNLLPFYIKNKVGYFDYNNILEIDYRNEWWKKYGELTGRNYQAMPYELQKEEFDEITSSPLTCQLVAISYNNNKIDFSKEINLCEIYYDLIIGIYDRPYEKDRENPENRVHRVLDYFQDIEDFAKVLMDVAVAIWHEEKRSVKVSDIEEQCKRSGTTHLLKNLQEVAKDNDLNILFLTFYFRAIKDDNDSSLGKFEFTHKSFGEYLIAKKIVSELEAISDKLNKSKIDDRNIEIALSQWRDLCGQTTLDIDIARFIDDEIIFRKQKFESDGDSAAEATGKIEGWQKTLCLLIGWVAENGMVFEDDKRKSHKEETRISINAEIALLVLHSACAWVTEKSFEIEWNYNGNKNNTWNWLTRLQSIGNKFTLRFVKYSLNGLFLEDSDLNNINLNGADLTGTNLRRADLRGADLRGADLRGADLEYADLKYSDLMYADLKYADLKYADLIGADLSGVDLSGADLRKAELISLEFKGGNQKNIFEESVERLNVEMKNAIIDESTQFDKDKIDIVTYNDNGKLRIKKFTIKE